MPQIPSELNANLLKQSQTYYVWELFENLFEKYVWELFEKLFDDFCATSRRFFHVERLIKTSPQCFCEEKIVTIFGKRTAVVHIVLIHFPGRELNTPLWIFLKTIQEQNESSQAKHMWSRSLKRDCNTGYSWGKSLLSYKWSPDQITFIFSNISQTCLRFCLRYIFSGFISFCGLILTLWVKYTRKQSN